MDEGKTILAYGGGTNSTALIVGWVERGLPKLDAILFAARVWTTLREPTSDCLIYQLQGTILAPCTRRNE